MSRDKSLKSVDDLLNEAKELAEKVKKAVDELDEDSEGADVDDILGDDEHEEAPLQELFDVLEELGDALEEEEDA